MQDVWKGGGGTGGNKNMGRYGKMQKTKQKIIIAKR